MLLRQSTSVVIPFGPFLDKTDGVTLETGLVSALDNASTGIMISKNGAAMAVRHATVTTTVYDAHGVYRVTLDTTDTNTLGSLRVIYTDATTCLPVWQDFQIVTANEWDSQCASAIRAVNATQLSGTALTGRDIGASVLLSSGTGTGQISLASGRAKSDPWDVALPGAYSAGSGGYILGSLGAGADPWDVSLPGAYASGKAGYLLGTYVNASIAAVKAKTDSLTFTSAGYVDANVLKIAGVTQADERIKIESNTVTNTAIVGFPFLMVDAANQPRTGLTDCTGFREIDGGSFSACANAVVEIGSGWYAIDLANSDVNGAVIALRFVATGAQDRCITLIMTP